MQNEQAPPIFKSWQQFYVFVYAVFIAALIAEVIVITVFALHKYQYVYIAYLWLNLIGCVLVIGIAILLESLMKKPVVPQI